MTSNPIPFFLSVDSLIKTGRDGYPVYFSLSPEGPEWRDHHSQSGIRDEGKCREGHRGDQDARAQCHGGGQDRVARVNFH